MTKTSFRDEAREIMAGADEALVDELMQGAVDLHVHSGPSTMPRQLDHFQAVEQAAQAGMRAVLFKDHHYSVAPFIPIMDRVLGHHGVKMFGGLVLNNAPGGLNPYAVDFNVKSGAKLIWMPTAHAANHIRNTHRKARLASTVQLKKPYGITVVDANGQLLDVVKEILDIIAEHDVILSSGHLHIAEVWPLFDEAKRRGVGKLLVNHPSYGLHCTYDDMAELAGMGAVLEQSACLYVDSRFNVYPPQELKRQIDAAGVDNSSIGSDLGQVDNPSPVEGMRQAIKLCLGLGYSPDEIRKLVGTNSARLLGLDQ
ncbi:DUF6282 family protein [Pelagibacterium xiamenense]|uniref:DUF6282 family protein n=1 Tax=Pelagibacterium xiamenense TaxID=2901140 RepID=UPI001E42F8A9|nr:DUF6282 family protein [Pelagibacterium xiamenense]MCD7060643.1 DUF6282 family protein [Pelagibacterium xiamenense]